MDGAAGAMGSPLEANAAYYRGLGMEEREGPASEDLFTPTPPGGSRLLCFGDTARETGLLLLPPGIEAGGSRSLGALQGLSIVTSPGAGSGRDPAGRDVEVQDFAAFEAGLPLAEVQDLTLAGVPVLKL